MERLAPGEVAEPRPVPPAPPAAPQTRSGFPDPGLQQSIYGTLAVRVAPRAAAVLIDGELWQHGLRSQEGLAVQLPEGLHRVEVSSDGYESFSSDVSIRRGETTSLNVSLKAR